MGCSFPAPVCFLCQTADFLNATGMAGFVIWGILLPAAQTLEFAFQGFNGWILLGILAVISGMGFISNQTKGFLCLPDVEI
jgi:hypothetical protein